MPFRSGLAALAGLALGAALTAAPDTPTPGTASGRFEDRKWKLELAGAYAFRDKTRGTGDEERIQVAVSNTGFLAAALDEYYDRGHAISTLFADEETKVVYFEFDDAGGYHGLSYYFESGVGCGWCYDSKVKSTVHAVDGRLKGDLSYRSDDRSFQVTLDVPIPSRAWGDPLPRNGGDPGKAYLAWSSALEKRDKKAFYALSDADMKKRFDEFAKQERLDGWLDYRWHDEHTELRTIRITGGFVRGDRAVVLFDASNGYIDHCTAKRSCAARAERGSSTKTWSRSERVRSRAGGYSSPTAREARTAMHRSEIMACTIVRSFAHRESTGVSVGENAVLVQKAMKR